jgi:hypothetical protein
MPVLKNSTNHALECLRLESECKQLAIQTANADLQSHFVKMASVWSALAENGPLATGAKSPIH